MRVLGLDIGERRVGVAVSDARAHVATPLTVLDGPLSADIAALRRLVDDYEVETLVVGLPLSMNGQEGPQAVRVRHEADGLARLLPVSVVYYDERLSSAEANRLMAEAGASSRKRRGSVDMVAAAIVLQSYLDANRDTEDGEE
ncbi:MAG: Holliday junction resolvase RuvX, partial [Actinomycetota bacterium]|nr:Holliday junction resolvase RuvX [Actinomycetota bacterium]MDZ4180375.1 Holliday junction resolvase RuvX [Coriobacteriia bacterium]